jgi:hypothetical protein
VNLIDLLNNPASIMRKVSYAFLLILFAVAPAVADLQRVEAVGIYGIRNSMRSKVIPLDEAIDRGLWEGVSRVALELIGESSIDLESDSFGRLEDEVVDVREAVVAPIDGRPVGDLGPDPRLARDGLSQDEVALVEAALGKDMLPYTRSFRILKDTGEVPVLFADEPGIETEYVVVVEVIVDVDRVIGALERAGLVSASASSMSAEAVRLEVVGLTRHDAVTRTVDALREGLGATDVQVVEFRRSLQVFSVSGPFGAEGLAQRLLQTQDPRLRFDPVSVHRGERRVRVRGRWSPEEGPN